MNGRIKAGQGTLIGNAGEYYVVAELLKRGIIAALAPRNAPAFDILATYDNKMVRIRVKTKTDKYDAWQWNAKKDGIIFRDLDNQDDFTILVNLAMDYREMTFYVIPTHLLNKWLIEDFQEWVATPGKRGRPHNASSKKRNLRYKKYQDALQQYLNNWDILWH
ncbi:MAG: hypothetical protein JW953_04550 [Anaerolineae bacterium]|nr:hypothetical protein [Anaerolineae bacterium]